MYPLLFRGRLCLTLLLTLLPGLAMASELHGMPAPGGIRLEFILFALTLLGVALFHHYTMWISLGGLALVLLSKYLFLDDFSMLHHLLGGVGQEGEWRVLLNLTGLLFGFAILAKHFEESELPQLLPKYLPDDWKGGFMLLTMVFVCSAFLDNIAAAMIGGASPLRCSTSESMSATWPPLSPPATPAAQAPWSVIPPPR